jgi:hypothetical protein
VALSPIQFPGFDGGLNLVNQPDEQDQTQALDLLNVSFVVRGAVKSRDGYGLLTAAPGTNRYDSLSPYYTAGGTRQLVAGAGNRLEGLTTAGAIVASSTAPTASPHYFARYGGEAGEYVFCANGTDNLRRWDGAAFTTPSWTGTAPTGRFVAVTPWDNRLVNARRSNIGTAGDNPSSVRFSDPGLPTTWGANNYVDLNPGDGSQITGLAVWGGGLYVFKDTSIYVFTQTATDSTGQPEFIYRQVDAQVGCSSPRAITVGRDGIYFLNSRGVYRTQGYQSQLMSSIIDPFFYGTPSDFFASDTLNQSALSACAMAWDHELLYIAAPTGGSTVNDRMLVFDPRVGWWSLYDLPAAALTSFQVSAGQSDLVFALSSGTNDVGHHSNLFTTDNGAAITSRWRSGWFDLQYRRHFIGTEQKTIRECKLWGTGTFSIGIGHDYQSAANAQFFDFTGVIDKWGDGTDPGDLWEDGTNPDDVWAVAQSLTPQLYRRAVRGTVFSVELNSTQPWALYRLATHLRDVRDPSVIRG